MVTDSHDFVQAESDPVETTFELNDTLYCKASIPPTEEIYLWLGVWLRTPERAYLSTIHG